MKRICLLILALLLALPGDALAERWDDTVGQTVPDFELICADGTRFCLSEALAEKPLAVVCVFGAGCGACQRELRALSLAYQLYRDQVAVVGLSLDRSRDTDEALNQFAADHGVAFPLGRDPMRTARFMQINMYPAFMIVNADQTVAYIEVNGPGTIDHFVSLFDEYLGQSPAFDAACTEDGCPLPADL